MVNNVLTTDGFYFCTDYDLTHTLQRLANTSPDFQEMSLLERVSEGGSQEIMAPMIKRIFFFLEYILESLHWSDVFIQSIF